MAFTDFLKHPFFGRGLLAHYQLTGNKITPHAHNIYLDMLESTGIFGTSAIIFIFSFFARQLLQAYRQGDESVKARVALCGSAIAATMVHGITDAPIVGFQTGMMFALLLSMCPKPVYITEALHRAKSSFAVSIKS
jgi:O-antigen ligase